MEACWSLTNVKADLTNASEVANLAKVLGVTVWQQANKVDKVICVEAAIAT